MDYNKGKEVNKVFFTADLTVFNQIKGNRPPNPQHIRRLCDSIKTHGILQSPIIVNKKMNIIDGQHRLIAADKTKTGIYYIIVEGYDLKEVQILNLNQKNWSKKDFIVGYANMGIESYVKLREFMQVNKEFNTAVCIAMCSNTTTSNTSDISQKYRPNYKNKMNQKEVFAEGTWQGKDFELAQVNANKIKMIKQYYVGYKRSSFITALLGLFKNNNFDFIEFLNKLKVQQNKMVDCTNVYQYKMLIEDIYNYRSRSKVNLRF